MNTPAMNRPVEKRNNYEVPTDDLAKKRIKKLLEFPREEGKDPFDDKSQPLGKVYDELCETHHDSMAVENLRDIALRIVKRLRQGDEIVVDDPSEHFMDLLEESTHNLGQHPREVAVKLNRFWGEVAELAPLIDQLVETRVSAAMEKENFDGVKQVKQYIHQAFEKVFENLMAVTGIEGLEKKGA